MARTPLPAISISVVKAAIALIVATIAIPKVVNNTEATVALRKAPTKSVKTDAQVEAAAIAPSTTAISSAIDRRRRCESCCASSDARAGLRLINRLRDLLDAVGHTPKPRRKYIEQRRDARQQEYRRQRYLNDVGDEVERR